MFCLSGLCLTMTEHQGLEIYTWLSYMSFRHFTEVQCPALLEEKNDILYNKCKYIILF